VQPLAAVLNLGKFWDKAARGRVKLITFGDA